MPDTMCKECGEYGTPGWVGAPEDQTPCPACVGPWRSTVDDMLAFLRGRGFHVMVHAWVKWPVHVRLQTCDTAEESSYGGPTLHAALEQAVIAVGRAG